MDEGGIGPSHTPLCESTKQSQGKDIHAFSEIRTRNPSKREQTHALDRTTTAMGQKANSVKTHSKVVSAHPIKACRAKGYILHLFLNLALDGAECSTLRPGSLYHLGKIPSYPRNSSLFRTGLNVFEGK